MAGMFELFLDDDARFRFQLTAPDGTVMAVSRAFSNKEEAVEGIAAVREYAGMGHVRDISVTRLRRTVPSRTDVRRECRAGEQIRPLVSATDSYFPVA
ncbi:YegP family protein [Arthrobacter sp. NPDC093139]|uniref:YegP family protein n=1 Tax=Arthrobacter sp. NPDC093139 TaxID=3363945 RepID=UPI0037F4D7CF